MAASDVSNAANASEDGVGAGVPTNSDILGAIRGLKEDITKQSADMMEAINGIKGELLSHSRRIGEAEERISLAEGGATALQQKVAQLEEKVGMLTSKVQDQEDQALI